MTRPIDETWCPGWRDTGNTDRDGHLLARVSDGVTLFHGGYSEEHARLAAAAPAMARLLLEREWRHGNESDWCPTCGEDAPGPHKADCAWLTTMRAAGVVA